jgi:hypothetical protein
MTDELFLSPTPIGEDCAQLGAADYSTKSSKECRAFINQLKRVFGEPPSGANLRIKACPHDFGTYKDVVVVFDDTNEAATEYAYKVEANLPEFWDEESLKEINQSMSNQ